MLHDFAREVLREQPEDVYSFGYQFFRSMEEVSHHSFFNLNFILVQGEPFVFDPMGGLAPPESE